jgi:DNA polymerase
MCPGPDENVAGIPFVGAAGQVLNSIIKAAYNDEGAAYITNLVKCYVAPGTQLQQIWMDTCLPYFLAQVGFLKPKVVIALGKDVCNYLLGVNEEMRNLRGQVRDYFGRKLICTYHPSYLARGGGIKHKHFEIVVGDFKKAIGLI